MMLEELQRRNYFEITTRKCFSNGISVMGLEMKRHTSSIFNWQQPLPDSVSPQLVLPGTRWRKVRAGTRV
jgi:hypothetical protein